MSLCVRKPTIWVLTRSYTNQPVQSHKQTRKRNSRFRKERYCSISKAKTKALISCAITAQLICGFVFAYADSWFSDAVAQISDPAKNYCMLLAASNSEIEKKGVSCVISMITMWLVGVCFHRTQLNV